jgi:hypothetical protein
VAIRLATDTNIHGDNSVDSHLNRLIEKVAQAGSWAVWIGVYSRGRMEMLIAGGGCRILVHAN